MTIPEMIEVLQAAQRGEEIQYKDRAGWRTAKPTFDFGIWEYRVKPNPTLVPLGPEDVPPGAMFKRESWSKNEWFQWLRFNETGVEFSNRGFVPWDKLRDWLISCDGGITWKRCEKPESV